MSRDLPGKELPRYRQIADQLRAEIESGRYSPGDRLPGENDLMATHGVARMTARQALAQLQAEGLAVAHKGKGVFVRGFEPIRRRSIPRLAADQWGEGRTIWDADVPDRALEVDQLEVFEADPPDSVARVLGQQRVVVRSRRFVLDDNPVLLAVSYLPASIAAGTQITEPDTGPGGTYARLADLGHTPTHFREELRSRMPLTEEIERLQLPAGTPVVVIYRTAYTTAGRAVEVNQMTLDASAYVIEYEFDA